MGKTFFKKSIPLFLCVVISAVTLTLFQNCGVSQPKVEDMSSLSASGFSHSPIPSSCLSCHVEARPAMNVAVTKASDRMSDLFFHKGVYNGENDCVQCHTQNAAEVGKTWRNGVFSHKTNTGVTVSTCLECHTGNRPTTGTAAHTASNGRMGDCITCHTNVGANWSTQTFSHTPTPTSCMSCHLSDRPGSATYYPSNPASPSLNLYVHTSQYNGTSDCVSCHTAVVANVGVKWAGGYYSHTTDTGAKVTNCMNCHTGNRPTTGTKAHTSANNQLGECYTCHTNAGVSWAAKYSHTPTPTACLSCHTSDKPAATTYYPSNSATPSLDLYAHQTKYAGDTDCVNCHIKVTANIGVKWAGGSYNHKTATGAVVATCTDCHTGNRPSAHVTKGYTGDCISCHTKVGVDWSANVTTFSHTPTPSACLTCHTADKPAATKTYPASAAAPTKNLYSHQTKYAGDTDCVNCHIKVTANIGVKWAGGFYNHKTGTGTAVATCTDCHTGDRPSAHVTKGYTGDCISCHTKVGVDWSASGGTTALPASVTYPAPTGTSWAAVTTAHPSATSQTGMTCATCHVNYNATKSIMQFDHKSMPSGTKCVSCHVSSQQVVDTSKVSMTTVSSGHRGTSNSKDCNSCHSVTYPTWNATTKKFSGGRW